MKTKFFYILFILLLISTIYLPNTSAQEIPYTVLKGHSRSVNSVAFSPDGKTLASGSYDRTIRLWDRSTGDIKNTLTGHRYGVQSVAFSPDGQTLTSGSGDTTIRLWDASTGDLINTLTGHRGWVQSVAFSPDGTTLASGSYDNTIRLWDASTGEIIRILRGHRDIVYSVAFSPDEQTFASGSRDNTIRLWDASTGDTIRTLTGHTDYVYSVAFSPDGKTLASGSRDYTIRLWDASTGELINTLTGHRNTVSSVAFSPDGQTLASGSGDNTIRLWNVETGETIRTLTGHSGWVYSVAFSPDGQTLASGSADSTIRLWKFPAKVSITPSQMESPTIGEQFSINVSIAGGENIGGYQFTVGFDTTALRHIENANGDYLPEGAYFVPPVVTENRISLGATTLGDVGSGDGTLATVTFEVVDVKESNLTLSNVILTNSAGVHLANFAIGGKIVEPAEPEEPIEPEEPETIPSSAVVSITPSSVRSPTIGGQLTFNVDITGAETITDYHFTWEFDNTVLEYISSSEVYNLVDGIDSGDGTLETRTFKVRNVKPSTVRLSGYFIGTDGLRYIPTFKNAKVVVPTSPAVVSVTPASVLSPAIGEQITFSFDIAGGQSIANYRLTWKYDSTTLEYISRSSGDYLADGVGNGDGTLFTLTFKVRNVKASTVSISGHLVDTEGIVNIPTFVSAEILEPIFGDVNRDGVVDISDLVLVGSSFGQRVPGGSGNPADVNEDGTIDIVDLVKVAGVISADSAAPTVLSRDLEGAPTRVDVQEWLTQAQQLNLTDATSQQGIHFLKLLLAALTPKKTSLLPNYPNPFNPETWIPYQLAKPADVTVTIYAIDGKLVRKLELGHQPIGIYQHRERAAHWDGKNEIGESVASGVYLYTLTAGKFTATRKMLITK